MRPTFDVCTTFLGDTGTFGRLRRDLSAGGDIGTTLGGIGKLRLPDVAMIVCLRSVIIGALAGGDRVPTPPRVGSAGRGTRRRFSCLMMMGSGIRYFGGSGSGREICLLKCIETRLLEGEGHMKLVGECGVVAVCMDERSLRAAFASAGRLGGGAGNRAAISWDSGEEELELAVKLVRICRDAL